MARPGKPWYRKNRALWYVQIDGHQYNLGSDKDEATGKFHALMLKRPKSVDPTTTVAILDAFLDWQSTRNQQTYQWYKKHIQSFATDIGTMPFAKLRANDIQQWIDGAKVPSSNC